MIYVIVNTETPIYIVIYTLDPSNLKIILMNYKPKNNITMFITTSVMEPEL